jgi:Zn-dependent peptidase ImmA (M78 family)
LYREDNQSIIAVNRLHPVTRQRFTMAHELGHLILNHKGNFFIDRGLINYRDSKSGTGEDIQEREANAFAAELLMPEEMLKRDFKKGIYDIENPESMEKLANKYKVSVQALTFRLVNLGIVG